MTYTEKILKYYEDLQSNRQFNFEMGGSSLSRKTKFNVAISVVSEIFKSL